MGSGDALEVLRAVVLSAAHVTEDDGALLRAELAGVYGDRSGFRHILRPSVILEDEECRWSDVAHAVARWAMARNFDLIVFDADGPRRSDLPRFEW